MMPFISSFFGIIIRMFYKEHNPPHFHAEYQGKDAEFDFNGEFIKGNLQSKNAIRLIKEWALLNQNELNQNWNNIVNKIELNKIKPLD
jgi:hypothetical protein